MIPVFSCFACLESITATYANHTFCTATICYEKIRCYHICMVNNIWGEGWRGKSTNSGKACKALIYNFCQKWSYSPACAEQVYSSFLQTAFRWQSPWPFRNVMWMTHLGNKPCLPVNKPWLPTMVCLGINQPQSRVQKIYSPPKFIACCFCSAWRNWAAWTNTLIIQSVA